MKKFRDWKDILYDECKDKSINKAFVNKDKETLKGLNKESEKMLKEFNKK